MSDSLKFRDTFTELIENFECTKSETAKQIGIDYNIFKNILTYGKVPKPLILIRIANYFNISIEYLLGLSEDNYFEKSMSPSSFLERYTQLKQENDFTDYMIAQKLHVSTSYTTNWKKRGFVPSLDNLMILSEIFQVSLDYLLGRTDIKN